MVEQRTYGRFEQHQNRFERVLTDVLVVEPQGLHAHEPRERFHQHTDWNLALDPEEFMAWLEQASRDVVIDTLWDPWPYQAPGITGSDDDGVGA